MGLPGHRRTSSHKRRRAAHFALATKSLVKCPKCGKAVLPHHMCALCGTYKKQEVVVIKAKRKTEKQKAQARKEKTREKEAKKAE